MYSIGTMYSTDLYIEWQAEVQEKIERGGRKCVRKKRRESERERRERE